MIVEDQRSAEQRKCVGVEGRIEGKYVLDDTQSLDVSARRRVYWYVDRRLRSRPSIFMALRVRYEIIIEPMVKSVPVSPKTMAILRLGILFETSQGVAI